ncbi:unnamed protein product [Ambrosiozyma monospora]|uniref:Unnamed protein product n=1 Tax=Ambrosiozyma monospora TaxID=43982 RepID=A0A9W6T1U0_AMBMO|nr:unnamed protein product [Ambrosiozyma monospora]
MVPNSSTSSFGVSNIVSPHISLKKDHKRVLECLQKALRIADSILDVNVSLELFIEILNQSLYYFIHGNEMINSKYLNGLIELISNNFKTVGVPDHNGEGAEAGDKKKKLDAVLEVTWKHFQRTLNYIMEQQTNDSRFAVIAI